MSPGKQITVLAILLLLAFSFQPHIILSATAQESPASVRRRFSVLPRNPRCHPATVKVVSFGRQPIEAILAQVTVENNSDKTITAMKLGWKVYREPEGGKIPLASCDAPPSAARVLLSGTTSLIQLDELAAKETSIIDDQAEGGGISLAEGFDEDALEAELVKMLGEGHQSSFERRFD